MNVNLIQAENKNFTNCRKYSPCSREFDFEILLLPTRNVLVMYSLQRNHPRSVAVACLFVEIGPDFLPLIESDSTCDDDDV